MESLDGDFAFRAFNPQQAQVLWSLIVSDRHAPERKNSWPVIKNLDQLSEFLQNCDIENPIAEENGYCLFFKNKMIGTFHWHSVSWELQRVEIGYWLHFEFEGQGFISKTLPLMEQQLQKMGFHRVEIRCNPQNRKSCAVAERNNYLLEGTLRDHKIENSKFCDTAIYAKLFES